MSDESKIIAHYQPLLLLLDAHWAHFQRHCREENLQEGSPWRGWRGTRKEMWRLWWLGSACLCYWSTSSRDWKSICSSSTSSFGSLYRIIYRVRDGHSLCRWAVSHCPWAVLCHTYNIFYWSLMGGCQLTLNFPLAIEAEFNTALSRWFVNATLWPADKVNFLSPGEFNESFFLRTWSRCWWDKKYTPVLVVKLVIRFVVFFSVHLIHIHSDIYITPAYPSSSPFKNLNHICRLAAAASSSSCSWYNSIINNNDDSWDGHEWLTDDIHCF